MYIFYQISPYFGKKLTVLSKCTRFFLRMVYNTPKHVGDIW